MHRSSTRPSSNTSRGFSPASLRSTARNSQSVSQTIALPSKSTRTVPQTSLSRSFTSHVNPHPRPLISTMLSVSKRLHATTSSRSPSTIHRRTFTTSTTDSGPVELNTHIIRSQNPTKPPLFILHGLLGHLGNWRMIANKPQLNQDRDIITVDLRNHGASPRSEVMTYEAMSDDIAHLIQKISPGQAVTLIGHSMGGKVTAATALRYPHLLAGAVLVDILPIPYSEEAMADTRGILESVAKVDLSNNASRANVMDQLAVHIPNIGIRQWLSTNLVGQDPDATGATLRWKPQVDILLDQYSKVREFDLGGNLPFHGPTLLLLGGNSDFADPKTALDIMTPMFPECEVRVVEGAGHWLHAEKPNEVVQELSGFLTAHHL